MLSFVPSSKAAEAADEASLAHRARGPPVEQPTLRSPTLPDIALQPRPPHGVVSHLLAVAALSLLAVAAPTRPAALRSSPPDHEHGGKPSWSEWSNDPIVVDINGSRNEYVAGIDTPESVTVNRPEQCFGWERRLSHLAPTGENRGHPGPRHRGRDRTTDFAYVVRSSDQLFVNLNCSRGYAGVMIFEPNGFCHGLFEDAENDAFKPVSALWCGGPMASVNVARDLTRTGARPQRRRPAPVLSADLLGRRMPRQRRVSLFRDGCATTATLMMPGHGLARCRPSDQCRRPRRGNPSDPQR